MAGCCIIYKISEDDNLPKFYFAPAAAEPEAEPAAAEPAAAEPKAAPKAAPEAAPVAAAPAATAPKAKKPSLPYTAVVTFDKANSVFKDTKIEIEDETCFRKNDLLKEPIDLNKLDERQQIKLMYGYLCCYAEKLNTIYSLANKKCVCYCVKNNTLNIVIKKLDNEHVYTDVLDIDTIVKSPSYTNNILLTEDTKWKEETNKIKEDMSNEFNAYYKHYNEHALSNTNIHAPSNANIHAPSNANIHTPLNANIHAPSNANIQYYATLLIKAASATAAFAAKNAANAAVAAFLAAMVVADPKRVIKSTITNIISGKHFLNSRTNTNRATKEIEKTNTNRATKEIDLDKYNEYMEQDINTFFNNCIELIRTSITEYSPEDFKNITDPNISYKASSVFNTEEAKIVKKEIKNKIYTLYAIFITYITIIIQDIKDLVQFTSPNDIQSTKDKEKINYITLTGTSGMYSTEWVYNELLDLFFTNIVEKLNSKTTIKIKTIISEFYKTNIESYEPNISERMAERLLDILYYRNRNHVITRKYVITFHKDVLNTSSDNMG